MYKGLKIKENSPDIINSNSGNLFFLENVWIEDEKHGVLAFDRTNFDLLFFDGIVDKVFELLAVEEYFDENEIVLLKKYADFIFNELEVDDEIEKTNLFYSVGLNSQYNKAALYVNFTIEWGNKLLLIKDKAKKADLLWEKTVTEKLKLKLRTVNIAMRLAKSSIDKKYYYLTSDVLNELVSAAKENSIDINNFIEQFSKNEVSEQDNEDELKSRAKKYCLFRKFYKELKKITNVNKNLVKDVFYSDIVLGEKSLEHVKRITDNFGDTESYFKYILSTSRIPNSLEDFLLTPFTQDFLSPLPYDQAEVKFFPEHLVSTSKLIPDAIDETNSNTNQVSVFESTCQINYSENKSISLLLGTVITKCSNIISEKLIADKISINQINDTIDALKNLKKYWHGS